MPPVLRLPTRMDCNGIDLVHPVDRMPPGYFPYLFNARVLVEGRIDARPGYVSVNPPTTTKLLHSIRRLNDLALDYNASGFTYVIGDGTTLLSGPETAPTQIDTGYSGKPLSLLTFQPEQSPVSWMYVYDSNKQVKVRPDGELRTIGLPPPTAPTIEYTEPASVTLADGNDITGWVGYLAGAAQTISAVDRTNGSVSTISAIVYNAGVNGWCCINPTTVSRFSWAGERMLVLLDSGGGNEEEVAVREIHPAISTTTIDQIEYDSGTSGMCTVVLVGSPAGLERNSLVQLGAEVVRVLSVTQSANGSTYSFRCSTTSTHASGTAVSGLISWYVYTSLTHAATETITASSINVTSGATGASMAKLQTIDAGLANGRPISLSDDYLHISMFLQNPQLVTSVRIQVDIDSGTSSVGNAGNAFTKNFITWTVSAAQIVELVGSGTGNNWIEIVVPLADGVRSGIDLTRNLSDIQALQVTVVSSSACAFGIASWYLFGTYGPTVAQNSTTGLFYETRNRDATTGVASIPGPPTRYSLYPLREGIEIQADETLVPGVDSLDIYRQGGGLADYTYVGTAVRSGGVTPPLLDTQDDLTLAGRPGPDLTLLQPWPILQKAWRGTVNVIGTRVVWVSGDKFDVDLVSASVITINGVAYQTYGNPISDTELDIVVDAGVQASSNYEIASPTVAGQPLPTAFGPLEGPYVPVIFALGSVDNPGNLYYTNPSNADGADSSNYVQITSPSEPLIGGGVWSQFVFAASQDKLYLVRYSFLGNVQQYQFNAIPAASGQWNRYACCTGPDGWYYVGRDGIYRATDAGAVSVTDAQLYPLFPHDGQQPGPEHDLYPVNMNAPMRLTAGDADVFFDYVDTAGNSVTMRLDVLKQRWFPHVYADNIAVHYLVERSVNTPSQQQILMLSKTLGFIYRVGGDDDNGEAITTIVQPASMDGGDERSEKLWVDVMTDFEGAGDVDIAMGYNNNTVYSPITALTVGATRAQYVTNLAELTDLDTYRNISIKAVWTGGPSGPKFYAYEPSGYQQPYLATSRVTQFIKPAGLQGWLHHRRLFGAIISTAAVEFTIDCQDGRSYGPYTLPSTGGRLRIWVVMLDHGIKDLAFAYGIESPSAAKFALFDDEFTVEMKNWTQAEYVDVPVFKL